MNTTVSQYIYKILQYEFKNEDLLNYAILHPSNTTYNNCTKFNYEKLEFLGDSVLSLIITHQLLEEFPLENEGDLAKRKAYLISGNTIAIIAKEKNLGQIMNILPTNEAERSNDSNLENLLEAIIGAIYIDGGLLKISQIIKKLWHPYIIKDITPPQNPKSMLQEIAQASKQNLKYTIIKITGPSHKPIFTAKVSLNLNAITTANSKQKAEIKTAKQIILNLCCTKISTQNPKSILQAITQDDKQINYITTKTGPSHKPIFTTKVSLNINTHGTANSKQKAEIEAAQNMLSLINNTITKYSL